MKFKEILDQVPTTEIKGRRPLIYNLITEKMQGKIMISYPHIDPQRLQWLDDNGFKHSYNKNLGEHEILIEEYT